MKTSLSGALPALVCAAVLALPSGEAGAQRNQCGALSSGAATCANQAYTAADGGIRYDVADGWVNGVAGDVGLTVTGGAATTITSPTAAAGGWASGIVLRTAVQGSGDATSRTVTLNAGLDAGAGAPAVVIAQSNNILTGGFDNSGVVIHQRGNAADATTVTLGSNVAIGTSMAPMKKFGVTVLVEIGTNTATQTIASAATIHSTEWGLMMDNRGRGNTAITNTGSITTEATGGTIYNKSGIRVLDWSGNRGANRTADTTTTVTNSGAITVSAAGAHGIHVDADGLGLYRVVHSGTGTKKIMASGENGHGIYVNASFHDGAAGTDAVGIESSGDITASGENARGIFVNAIRSGAAGAIDITASAGTITAGSNTGEGDAGIWVVNIGAGAITVANSATIAASTFGVFANSRGAGGAVTVTHSAGAITSRRGVGIAAVVGNANSRGNTSDVTVNVTGGSVTASPIRNSVAISAHTWGTGSVNVDVDAGATLTSKNNVGVFAVIEDNPNNRAGGIAIDQAGAISGRGGVYALVTPHASDTVRADSAQPVIDVTWTGTFTQFDRGADVVQANNLIHALEIDHESTVKDILRVGGGSGILAEVMSWRTASHVVSQADKQTIADAAAADAILDSTSGDMAKLKSKILQEIEEALANTGYTIAGVDTTGVDISDDDQLAMWLKGRSDRAAVMTHALQYAFTEQEKTLLRALANGGDVTGALSRLETAIGTLPTGYRARVMEIARYHNDGNIRIMVNAPSSMNGMNGTSRIVSATDGVRAIFAFADDRNGSIEVTVGQGVEITGGGAGIYVANAGFASDGVRKQHVTVHGTVTGGTDAAVHLAGGGRLTVGRTGRVLAGSSGKAVLVNDPGRAEIDVHGLVRGGSDAAIHLAGGGRLTVGRTGQVLAGSSGKAVLADDPGRAEIDVHGLVRGGSDAAIHLAGGGRLTVGRTGQVLAGSSGKAVLADDPGRAEIDVHGLVRGGSDAAIHLAGGGRLTVGRTGQVLAGSSGKAVLADDPGRAEIHVHGLVRGAPGALAAVHLTGSGTVTVGLNGRIEPNGAEHPIYFDDAGELVLPVAPNTRQTPETRAEIHKRVGGTIGAADGARIVVSYPEFVDGSPTGHSVSLPIEDLDEWWSQDTEEPDITPPPDNKPREKEPPPRTFNCEGTMDKRCRLYEALPSVLLAMNALPARDARLSAARDANGGWALVEGASSEWKAESATQPGGVAYDLRGHGVRAGVELAAGERLRVGVSAHHLRGNAKMSPVGEIELSGAGAGVNAAFAEDGFYADAQAAVTWFDAKLSSAGRGVLENDANGVGYALGLEAGKRIDVSRALSVTPRAGLEWSDASMSSFVFIDNVGSGVRVSVDEAQALTGRVGARVEAAPSGDDGVLLFGALDVSHLLSQGAGARVADTALKTTSEETGLRAGLGASWSGDEGFSLQGAAHYAASGGDNRGFGGSLSLAMRF